jgi:hypothetical protein
MAKYLEWSEEAMAKSPESAVVFFSSGYGSTMAYHCTCTR